MLCPACKTESLAISNRQEIEIDYCPKCRGVWLDRGELDKLIERSLRMMDRPPSQPEDSDRPPPRYQTSDDDRRRWDHDRQYRDDDYHKRRRRKSMWGEIFDFD